MVGGSSRHDLERVVDQFEDRPTLPDDGISKDGAIASIRRHRRIVVRLREPGRAHDVGKEECHGPTVSPRVVRVSKYCRVSSRLWFLLLRVM